MIEKRAPSGFVSAPPWSSRSFTAIANGTPEGNFPATQAYIASAPGWSGSNPMQSPSERKVRQCVSHATDCRLRASRSSDDRTRQGWWDLQERWMSLARTYQYLAHFDEDRTYLSAHEGDAGIRENVNGIIGDTIRLVEIIEEGRIDLPPDEQRYLVQFFTSQIVLFRRVLTT